MTRHDNLALSYGATAKARENTVKQDREQATNVIGIARKGPDFCAERNLYEGQVAWTVSWLFLNDG